MVDIAKYMPINGTTTVTTDFKNLSSIIKTRRTVAFFLFAFVCFTVILAFTPSSNSSAPWVTNIFSASSTTSATTSADSYRSQFSSLFDYLFSNTSSSPQQQQGLNFSSSSSSSNNNNNNTISNNTAPQLANPSEEQVSERNNKTQSFNKNEEVPNSKNTTFQSPNTSTNNTQSSVLHANQTTISPPSVNKNPPSTSNQGEKKEDSDNPQVLEANQTIIVTEKAPVVANQSKNFPAKSDLSNKVSSGKGEKRVEQKGVRSNYTAFLAKNQGNGSGSTSRPSANQGIDNLIESLMNCDLFDGGWVKDNSYPLYKPGSCSFIDYQFSCITNGRPDKDYQKLKWKPKGCTLPRLNGGHMLELLRGKRLVFVGDSLNRNMWESLVCILRGAAKNPKNVYEAHGRHYFRGEPSYIFIFKDYNCTIEFFVSPYLVREWEMPDKNGTKKETLRLDLVGRTSDQYKSADILIFNTGHWWNHEKTSKGKDYYQEGSHVYYELNVLEAFRKALTTWARWVDVNVNPMKTMVFFRGYSATHFSGGQWNSGGACDSETKPTKTETFLTPYLPKMLVLESVLKEMKTHVTYLNITRLTDFRKDGHPSIYRKHRKRQNMSSEERKATLKYQDCSHWCLPGVPDSWNEILYSELLVKENKM